MSDRRGVERPASVNSVTRRWPDKGKMRERDDLCSDVLRLSGGEPRLCVTVLVWCGG